MPFLSASAVGGLGFEFFMFVVDWRHALRSEWPFINIIIIIITVLSSISISIIVLSSLFFLLRCVGALVCSSARHAACKPEPVFCYLWFTYDHYNSVFQLLMSQCNQ